MNSYEKYRKMVEKEVNEFPMFHAFNDEQFFKGMEKVGLRPGVKTDFKKIWIGWIKFKAINIKEKNGFVVFR